MEWFWPGSSTAGAGGGETREWPPGLCCFEVDGLRSRPHQLLGRMWVMPGMSCVLRTAPSHAAQRSDELPQGQASPLLLDLGAALGAALSLHDWAAPRSSHSAETERLKPSEKVALRDTFCMMRMFIIAIAISLRDLER